MAAQPRLRRAAACADRRWGLTATTNRAAHGTTSQVQGQRACSPELRRPA